MTKFNLEELNPGLLSSPQLLVLLKDGFLLENYDIKNVKSATYEMRLGGKFITKIDGETREFNLGEYESPSENIRSKVVLPRNSLTFITTYEKFKLPKNIIARFNLKSKWVHMGLLLGTGPIVDPEFCSRLLIPLHNFSNSPVEIRYLTNIISVEFTKTHDPSMVYPHKDGECKYIENENKNLDINKYIERVGTSLPESSISYQIKQIESVSNEARVGVKNVKRFGILGAIVTAVILYLTLFQLFMNVKDLVHNANKFIADSDKQLSLEIAELKNEIKELRLLVTDIDLFTKKNDIPEADQVDFP